MRFAAAALTLFAAVAALYLARGFAIPLLVGILASYTLRPLVERLHAWRLPRSVGAALVLASMVGGLGWIVFTVSDDVVALVERLPEAARTLRKNLSTARAGAPTALQNMQEAARELQGAAADAGNGAAARPKAGTRAVAPPAEPTWLRDYTLAQTALLAAVAAQTPIVLLLSYFLLASGQHFRRKLLVLVGPSLARKKRAVRILDEINVQVQHYLLATLVANVLVGTATWLAFLALGVDQAGAWGVAAGVLHFIPYLGPALIALGSGVAVFLQFNSLPAALGASGASLLVAGVVGMLFMTWLQGRVARVHVAVLFIALLFFGWLWGAWGLLLGAPLVAIAKVVFDRVDALRPAGQLLGR